MKELLMGNEAVALGALAAGVQVVCGYPGTPSTEALETVAKRNPGGVYVEWSVNEKAAAEVAAGASCSGARSMVTMKQMGLNVAADPVMCVNYLGVRGGMVIYVADDPGPISSQTEQDTRNFGRFAHIPVLDCNSPEQAFRLTQDAFVLSEEKGCPVILRSTTRVCHSCAVIDVPEIHAPGGASGFEKDPRWVIFPRLSYENKKKLIAREKLLEEEFSGYLENRISGSGPIGIACGGISCAYVRDAIEEIEGYEEKFTLLEIASPYPFPRKLAEKFLNATEQTIVFEELDPYIEDVLTELCGSGQRTGKVLGKRTGSVPVAGELSALKIQQCLEKTFGIRGTLKPGEFPDAPEMPVRPPVLCAGCPHRGAFYAVKRATAGRKSVYCGDIGCYTLGNAAPLDMVDTCLCMGAGITMAQGIRHVDPDTLCFAFVGDSTFFASGITGVVNAVYNRADMILAVLDNSTTAMTGHQPHPGIGLTMMGTRSRPVDIEQVLRGVGVTSVRTVDPLNLKASEEAVRAASEEEGVRAIIFRSPCIAVTKPKGCMEVREKDCIGCRTCIDEIGCPAVLMKNGTAFIDGSLCTGCGLCAQLCPADCITMEVSKS